MKKEFKTQKQSYRRIGKCRFCRDQKKTIDYKDIQTLQRFCNQQGKILPMRRNNNCVQHQRKIERAIKLARFMALLPYPGM
ncbi:MAG: 30S ribosomal protein S18 [Planctomycetota bacterium]